MAQSPDEKTYVEIPFIKQLKGMGWEHIEGDTAKSVRILDLGHRWASCGRNGNVNFNWRSDKERGQVCS
ncbi:MAG: M48 family metallopeptidase [Desulfobacterales bacterium]|nr:M48 family metallopeptidase [Desulfobacterales bacterium]